MKRRKRKDTKWPGPRNKATWVSRPRVGCPGGLGGSLSNNLSRVPAAPGDNRTHREGGRTGATSSSTQHRSRPAAGPTRAPWHHLGDPKPNSRTTSRAKRTPASPLPAGAGGRCHPYLEVAPHILGHGVIIDVEGQGELGVGLQRRRRHQDHAAGIHFTGSCSTQPAAPAPAARDGDEGGAGWGLCLTHSPAAASSSPISSAGISRCVTSTTSLLVSSCREHRDGAPLLHCSSSSPIPQGAVAWQWARAQKHHSITCFILSFSSSARRRASSFLCKHRDASLKPQHHRDAEAWDHTKVLLPWCSLSTPPRRWWGWESGGLWDLVVPPLPTSP